MFKRTRNVLRGCTDQNSGRIGHWSRMGNGLTLSYVISSVLQKITSVYEFFFFQAVSEQPQRSEHQLQNTASIDEMTVSDGCGLQDDEEDGSSDVMDCDVESVAETEDVECQYNSNTRDQVNNKSVNLKTHTDQSRVEFNIPPNTL